MAWCCNGYRVWDLWLESLQVRLLAIPLPLLFAHACLCHQVFGIGQRLNGWWCPAAGKVTLGLASHWPCVWLQWFIILEVHSLRKWDKQPACRDNTTKPPRDSMISVFCLDNWQGSKWDAMPYWNFPGRVKSWRHFFPAKYYTGILARHLVSWLSGKSLLFFPPDPDVIF